MIQDIFIIFAVAAGGGAADVDDAAFVADFSGDIYIEFPEKNGYFIFTIQLCICIGHCGMQEGLFSHTH